MDADLVVAQLWWSTSIGPGFMPSCSMILNWMSLTISCNDLPPLLGLID